MTRSESVPSDSRRQSSKPAGNPATPDQNRWFPGGSRVVPKTTTVDTLSGSPSRVGAQAPPTGTHSTTRPDPSTTCGTCQSYLQDNRTRLLPHLGRHVVTTGKPPARLVDKLVKTYHRLGHPGVATTELKPDPTKALEALRRLAKTRRTA